MMEVKAHGSIDVRKAADALNSHRVMTALAMTVYLAWWFVVQHFLPDAFNPLLSRLAVCGSFLAILGLSFVSDFFRSYLQQAYLLCAMFLTGHYFYLYRNNPSDLNWVTGSYITVIAVGSTISCRYCLALYSFFVAGICSYMVWLGHVDAISIGGLFTFIVLLNVINTLRHKVDREQQLRLDGESKKLAAETVNNAKMLFLANINHELRTPLTAISGFNQILRMGEPDKSEIELCTSRIQTNCDILLSMVERMLHLTEAGTALLAKKEENVDLQLFLEDVIRTERERMATKGLKSALTYLTPIPKEVISDKSHLACVLLNVLNNAAKFTPSGGIDVTVACFPKHDSSLMALEILVKDTGIGIPAPQAEHIFTTFNQVHGSYKREFGGAGVGLAVARRIARMHGGDVSLVESTVGLGSTFKITVNVSVVAAP